MNAASCFAAFASADEVFLIALSESGRSYRVQREHTNRGGVGW